MQRVFKLFGELQAVGFGQSHTLRAQGMCCTYAQPPHPLESRQTSKQVYNLPGSTVTADSVSTRVFRLWCGQTQKLCP